MPKRGRSYVTSMPPAKRKPFIRQVRATRFTSRTPNNPSPFVKLPWYKYTYEREYVQDENVNIPVETTVADIIGDIRTRLQFDGSANIRIKVSNSQIWCTAQQQLTIPLMDASFYNLTPGVSAYPRARLNDSGTLNMPAKCSFKWPSQDKTTILDNAATGTRLVCKTSGARNGTLFNVRVNVWFQTGTV